MMKKISFTLLIIFLSSLTACANRVTSVSDTNETMEVVSTDKITPIPTSIHTQESKIILENDFVLASAQIGTFKYIEIVMKNGTYEYEQTRQLPTYQGDFYIQYYEENKLVHEMKIEPFSFVDDETIFHGTFRLYVKDYNQDGNVEFLLGQGFSDKGTYYRMYSLLEDKTFKQIDVGTDNNCLFIWENDGSYELKKQDDKTWKYNQYNQEDGTVWEITIQRNGTSFEEKEKKSTNNK